MDPIRNPFSPGAGSRPPELVGRDAEIEEFDIAVQRLSLGRSARSMMLTGLRGVGKTVLLGEFGRIAEGHGWVHSAEEAGNGNRFVDSMATMTRQAMLRLSVGQRLADKAQRAFGVLKAFQFRWNLTDGSDITLEVAPVSGLTDSGSLEYDLAGLFTEVGRMAQDRNRGVLFTIDELQYLSRESLSALIAGLHRVSQEQVPFLVAGAGLPSLAALAGEAKSYAERLFVYSIIDRLQPAETGDALSTPAAAEGVKWEESALRRIAEETKGYPYYIQEYGKHSWDVAEGTDVITEADVEEAIPIALHALDTGFFRVRMNRATSAEHRYLKAMASLGSGPYRTRDAAAAMGKDTAGAGPYRDGLIKQGLCYAPRYGWIDFTVPMFDKFIRRTNLELFMRAAEGE